MADQHYHLTAQDAEGNIFAVVELNACRADTASLVICRAGGMVLTRARCGDDYQACRTAAFFARHHVA